MLEFEALLSQVARHLAWLDPPPVYIGGAIVPFYLDEFGREQMRPTKDVDCIVSAIYSHLEYTKLEAQLRSRGWQPDPDGPICRYLGPEGLIVDFMPVAPEILGFAGRWYPQTVESAMEMRLPDGQSISLPNVSLLFACKLEAFSDRGFKDPYLSKDLEDIVALLDGCITLEREISAASDELKSFVAENLRAILSSDQLIAAAEAQLPRGGSEDERLQRFNERVQRLAAMG
jgi:hypothetical protein